jgi:hypothetical protein
MSLKVQASVKDLNRQSLSASSSLLIHPSSIYVGLRPAARELTGPGRAHQSYDFA